MRVEHLGDERGAVLGIGDVGDANVDPGLGGGQLLQRGGVPRDPDDGVAEPREAQRALPSDPGRRAGDEDDPGTGRASGHAGDVPLSAKLKQV